MKIKLYMTILAIIITGSILWESEAATAAEQHMYQADKWSPDMTQPVDVYAHSSMHTRFIWSGCMVKTLNTSMMSGKSGHFTIINKKKSYLDHSKMGKPVAYIVSTAGKAVIVGACMQNETTLSEAMERYQQVLQHATQPRSGV